MHRISFPFPGPWCLLNPEPTAAVPDTDVCHRCLPSEYLSACQSLKCCSTAPHTRPSCACPLALHSFITVFSVGVEQLGLEVPRRDAGSAGCGTTASAPDLFKHRLRNDTLCHIKEKLLLLLKNKK